MLKTVRGAVNINYWWTPHEHQKLKKMLTVPLTVLSIRCPSAVYVNSSSHSFKLAKTVRGAVNINYRWTLYA
jgi:hypothetical protein